MSLNRLACIQLCPGWSVLSSLLRLECWSAGWHVMLMVPVYYKMSAGRVGHCSIVLTAGDHPAAPRRATVHVAYFDIRSMATSVVAVRCARESITSAIQVPFIVTLSNLVFIAALTSFCRAGVAGCAFWRLSRGALYRLMTSSAAESIVRLWMRVGNDYLTSGRASRRPGPAQSSLPARTVCLLSPAADRSTTRRLMVWRAIGWDNKVIQRYTLAL